MRLSSHTCTRRRRVPSPFPGDIAEPAGRYGRPQTGGRGGPGQSHIYIYIFERNKLCFPNLKLRARARLLFCCDFAPTHMHKHAHVPFVRSSSGRFSCTLTFSPSLSLSLFVSLRAHTQDDFLRLLYLTHVTIILIIIFNNYSRVDDR